MNSMPSPPPRRFPSWLPALGVLLLAGQAGRADVKMPAIFGDHMVLQQGTRVPVWGWAAPGEKVTVAIAGQTRGATADAGGKWRVDLDPIPADGQPLQMTVAGANTLSFQDVLAGEVWLCSGQSNMALNMAGTYDAKTDLPQAGDPLLRLFVVKNKTALAPETDVAGGKWLLCTPDTAKGFSAVGYYFGRDLRRSLNRPVGLIGSYQGATPAQAWTPLDALVADPGLKKGYWDSFKQLCATQDAVTAAHDRWLAAGGADYKAALVKFNIAAFQAQQKGLPAPARPQPPAAPEPPRLDDPQRPSVLFNAMIAPLIPYAIQGAVWYQGESNAGRRGEYHVLLPALITGWRERWDRGDFPFLIVQLPNYREPAKLPVEGGWPHVRDAQLKALALPNTGLAVTIDLGEAGNLHPGNKTHVGGRLALAARSVAYGEKIVASGPLVDTMKIADGKVRLTFCHADGGLKLGTPPAGTGIPAREAGVEPAGFAVAGADKKWVRARARLDGDAVVVWSDEVPNPVAVRYGWADNPPCNLYNQAGLPASPFRTDDWSL